MLSGLEDTVMQRAAPMAGVAQAVFTPRTQTVPPLMNPMLAVLLVEGTMLPFIVHWNWLARGSDAEVL